VAAECNACGAGIRWCEIETRNGLKRIPIDLEPVDTGDLTLRNIHRDLPLRAEKWTPHSTGPRYTSHRATCPERDPNDNYQGQQPSWVREPEGY
jgi:hypothetical protein